MHKTTSRHKLYTSKKIAVVRTDKLGDMVLTLPLCAELKKCCPNSEIILVANSYVAPLVESSPAVDRTVFIDEIPDFQSFLEKEKIGVAFFPRPRFNEALAAFRAHVPLRVGSAFRAYSLLFNKMVRDHRKSARFHEAEFNVRMLSSITGKHHPVELVRPVISASALKAAKAALKENKIENKFVIIHPGSGGSANDIPASTLGLAAADIASQSGYSIVLTGAENEAECCNDVHSKCPSAVNLCGKMDLSQLIALISMSEMLIANSTGALHIAAALGKSVVGLYPNTSHISSRRWGPYTYKARIVSPPVWDKNNIDNMALIRHEEVVEAAMNLLNAG